MIIERELGRKGMGTEKGEAGDDDMALKMIKVYYNALMKYNETHFVQMLRKYDAFNISSCRFS